MTEQWFQVASFLPSKRLDNDELQKQCPAFNAKYARNKLGISSRYVAEAETCVDMAYNAVMNLKGGKALADVDFLLVVTQSPDYILPSMSCILHKRLGLPDSVLAFDMNLGCSGYVYGLSAAVAYLTTGMAKKALVITVDMLSRYVNSEDYNNRALFGDGAAATILTKEGVKHFGSFVFGTDGKGADKLAAYNMLNIPIRHEDKTGFFMDGSAVMKFVLKMAPQKVKELLKNNNMEKSDIDYYVFHQGNKYMLRSLQALLKIEEEKMIIHLEQCGNTTSSTIPMALEDMLERGIELTGKNILLMGFGTGFSCAGTILHF